MEEISDALLALGGVLAGALATIIVAVLGYRRFRVEAKRKARELVDKYHDPIAASAFDLQSRIFNILKNDFLNKYLINGTKDEKQYALTNTLYVVAEFFGWIELLRQDIQFLKLGKAHRRRDFVSHLNNVRMVFLEERPDPTFRVLRGQQRAIGELMIAKPDNGAQRTCIGYASFVSRLEDPEFGRWFDQLENDVIRLAEGSANTDRILAIQHGLIDFLDFLDPNFERLPGGERLKA